MIKGKNYTVHIGNNLDILPTLESNSIDSIVTDPPYELGFMGKKWDSSGIAYNVELWRECLRVLKPGGHMLAFGGTRTWHRIAVAIEDAGFEVRDSIAWMYGSGFPKSLDISKAIDKRGGQGATLTKQIGEALKEARESRGISKTQADQMFCDGTTNWTWFEGRPAGQRPPTPETFARIVAEWKELEPLAALVAEAEREVIGQKTSGIANKEEKDRHTIGASKSVEVDITAPATPEAKQWEGWGTALKPAFEPVIVARKPLIGTVAENVLTYGTGGLNIDGSRIAGNKPSVPQPKLGVANGVYEFGTGEGRNGEMSDNSQGRWPANVILDPYTAELLDEQSGQVRGAGLYNRGNNYAETKAMFPINRAGNTSAMYSDSGGASRFFYVAKASKRDRNEGLEELPLIKGGAMSGAEYREGKPTNHPERQNFHPTVKPTTLMEYLIKLVTPPNGLVLDPFTGSGSTGKAALLNGFRFVGCELTEDYIPIIEGRLNHAEAMAEQAKEKEDEALF